MAKIIEVNHKGVTIKIREDKTRVDGKQYTNYIIPQYHGSDRIRHKRASVEEAKALAKQIAEAREVIPIAGLKREVRNALEALEQSGTRLDDAARVYAEAFKLVGAGEILEACRYWKEHRPSANFIPRKLNEAVDEFLDEKKLRTCEGRQQTNRSYLNTFSTAFPNRFEHEVTTSEIETMVNRKHWKPKTRNDFLGLVSLFYKWSIKKGYASVNPASPDAIERQVTATDIGIFTPSELRKMFDRVDDELKPFLALWSFTGLRQAEVARLTWHEIEQALTSGKLYLPESKSKTCARSIPIRHNLRAWLMAYRQASGPVLPENWHGIQRMSELARTISRQSKVHWKVNGPRHSFASYSLALDKNAPALVKEMGNSLRQLETHYWARSECITEREAAEWFSIAPTASADIIKLKDEEATQAAAASS